ncbi:hypothetical protein [Saccharopolyspora hattusasensis]|uniref:hypothetical protein n=1 Tax=Saccharopolyspora hattusasensis TaxID=1128679 RepID=UPI003D972BE5
MSGYGAVAVPPEHVQHRPFGCDVAGDVRVVEFFQQPRDRFVGRDFPLPTLRAAAAKVATWP